MIRATILFGVVIACAVMAGASPIPTPRTADAIEDASFIYKDFVRVIDGDTVEIFLGRRHGIGFIGVETDQGNTPCGLAATGRLWELTSGGVRFDADPGHVRDERDRALYYAFTPDGTSIEEALVREGYARASSRPSPYRRVLQEAERDARKAGRGCLWGGASAAPDPAAAPTLPVALSPDGRDALAAAPAGFEDILVAGGFAEATTFELVPDGRLFVAEKSGRVRVWKNGVVLPVPLIDIGAQVSDYWDRGLLGMALDPNFATNGYLYLLYTYEDNANNYFGTKTSRVSRVTVVGDTASPATMTTILGTVTGDSCNDFAPGTDCIPSDGPGHSIGTARFGNDGKLYVTTGDGASFGSVNSDALRAQNLDSLAGKMIRVNPDGTGVADNPFWNGNANHSRSKVWVRGLRNPFRMNMNPETGRMFVGDPGWDTTEEINVARKGANLGWPCYEGAAQQPGYRTQSLCQTLYTSGPAATPPLYEWSPGGPKAAVAGAFATGYAGDAQNAFFFGDYGQDWIKYLHVDADDNLIGQVTNFMDDVGGPVSIQRGADGQIYYLAINSGQVRHIRGASGNRQPIAVASANPSNGPQPLNVSFSSAGSSDPDGDPLTYAWSFGDGTAPGSGAAVSHTYANAGSFTARLTVSDDAGGSATDDVIITAGSTIPSITISAPEAGASYRVGDVIQLTGSGFDPDDGALPGAALSWEIILHHAGHLHFFLNATGSSTSFTVPDHGDNTYFEIFLRGTDSSGLTGQASVVINPQTVSLTVQTDPPGLGIVINGVSQPTPYVASVVVGSTYTVNAQTQGDNTFLAWSDGGAQQHNVTATVASTLTASFRSVVTFNDAAPVNENLNGQYPAGQISWGSTQWYLSGPWSAFTTNSAGFRANTITSAPFTFLLPRVITSLDAHNGGGGTATITLTCVGNPNVSRQLTAGATSTIVTGWTAPCTTVTFGSSNAWDTNIDNIVHVPVAAGADTDGDGVADISDNCVGTANANQLNSDADFIELGPWGKAYDDLTWPNSDLLGDACDADDDNDGLAESGALPCASATAATSATNRDSDGDRVLDGAECALGSDPANAASRPVVTLAQDADRDGLPTTLETSLGTNPADPDSDGDGVLDGVEYLNYNSSPLSANSDGDGCGDGREIASINADLVVSSIDLAQLGQSFGNASTPGYVPHMDLNRDGTISALDLAFLARYFGACP